LAPPPEDMGRIDWDEAVVLPLSEDDLDTEPARVEAGKGPFFAPPPAAANSPREFKRLVKDLADWLYHTRRVSVKVHPTLKVVKRPGEKERVFRMALHQAARERRDREMDALRAKYEKRIEKLEVRLRRLERELAEDEAEYEARKRETLLTTGESVISFLFGRRSTRVASSIARKHRLASKAKMEIEETRAEIREVQEQIKEIQEELEEALDEIRRKWEERVEEVEEVALKPRRTDVRVVWVALAWQPVWHIGYTGATGSREATFPAYPLTNGD